MAAKPWNLLFVCVENSCRSQMAEGFARTAGRGRFNAFSAGSRPSGTIDPRAVRFMLRRGINPGTQSSKVLDDLPPLEWDFIVTMGCGEACPVLPARHRLDWSVPDPKELDDQGFSAVCDRIEKLVLELLAGIEKQAR